MLKPEKVLNFELLSDILQTIWQTEPAPDDWKVSLELMLPKKGDIADTNNWRGVMLLPVTSKVLSTVIINRMA